MKTFIVTITLGVLLFTSLSYGEERRSVIQYGNTCVTVFGNRPESMGLNKAISALDTFFEERGFTTKIVNHSHRFLRVNVYKDGELVDSIIMDIRTGRLRSVN